MKKRFTLFLFTFTLSLSSFSQVFQQWASRYTSSGNFMDRAKAITIDASGNVYVTGIGYGSGNFDYVTIKYDNTGSQQWVSLYNGPGNGLDEARAIGVDASGNVYVTGWSASTGGAYACATVKYNSMGVQQWAQRYSGNANDGAGNAIYVTPAGDVYVAGYTTTTASGQDFLLIKYDMGGTQQWLQSYSNLASVNQDVASALTMDGAGFLYITGYSFNTGNGLDFATQKYNNTGGAAVWTRRYNYATANRDEIPNAIAVTATNVYVTGSSQQSGLNSFNDYVTQMINSSTGAQVWVNRYNGVAQEEDVANSIAVDGAGNCYVTGVSKGGATTAEDMVTIKYSLAGGQIWLRQYDGGVVNIDAGKSVQLDANANVFVTGYSHVGTDDCVTLKYDSTGVFNWKIKYNGTANSTDQSLALVLDNAPNAYITGVSKGSGSGDDFITIKYCQLTAVASNDTSICLGASVQLTSTATGAASYSWSPSAGLSCTTCANPVATPTATTSYVVTITNTNGCQDDDTVLVTVNPLPSPTISASGPTSFCMGGSVTLSTSGNYTGYLWSNSSTNDSIIVNMSGTYTVTVTNSSGCQGTASQLVTVFNPPTANAGPDTGVCVTFGVQLQASGGTTYSWTPSTGLNFTNISNPTASPTATTIYTVTVTDNNGCTATDDVKVTVHPNPPIPTITYSVPLLTSTSAFSYQWLDSLGNPITGATSQTYTATYNGIYSVMICNVFGCCSYSAQFTTTGVGIGEISGNISSLMIYPNPNNGSFVLNVGLNSSSPVIVSVYDITGRKIRQEQLEGSMKLNKEMHIDAGPGMYLLEVRTSTGLGRAKITVQ